MSKTGYALISWKDSQLISSSPTEIVAIKVCEHLLLVRCCNESLGSSVFKYGVLRIKDGGVRDIHNLLEKR